MLLCSPPMSIQNTPQYIDTDDELIQLCDTLHSREWLAVDTEFHRDKNYYPDLCLVQLGTPELAVCIDPLAIKDLSPLLDLLYSPSITKVMHAGRQDMEIFYYLRGDLPKPFFDTQLAAPLMGLEENIGYGSLVKAMLNVNLEKTHTRADWMRRPMPAAQIQYALDDVIYLADIFPKMQRKLDELQRLPWLEEDFAKLTSPDLYRNPPENAWRRLRGLNKLNPQSLSIMQTLAAWREQTAQQLNRPRNWICKDDVLFDLAKLMPTDMNELEHIRGMSEGFVKRHGEKLLGLIEQAKTEKPKALDDMKIRNKLSVKDYALIDAMMAIVSLSAADNQLHPSVIVSRKGLEALLNGGENESELFSGWRKKIVGEQLRAFLDGKIGLKVDQKCLVIA